MNIRNELKEYIESDIFEEYNLNEKGHGIDHIKYVIRRSLEFARTIENINYEMVYVIAAYHDIGHYIDAKNHEIVSAKMLSEDERLIDTLYIIWYNKTMKTAKILFSSFASTQVQKIIFFRRS